MKQISDGLNNDFFGEKVIRFYTDLQIGVPLPQGVRILRPFDNPESAQTAMAFYRKFYSDTSARTFIVGINPGRFGGGITGIPFTDPLKLEIECGIPNNFEARRELSADFIYQVINACGGPAVFYSRYYFTSVSPLGFTMNGVNMNYFDDKEFLSLLTPFMADWLRTQLEFGSNRARCICLGSGKNLKFLQKLNQQHSFFERIDVLDHPRFIMQYKRKFLADYVSQYKNAFLSDL